MKIVCVGYREWAMEIYQRLRLFYGNRHDFVLVDKKTSEQILGENDETVKKIIDVLDTKIRPAVARDGGDIKFNSFVNGVVKVELQGSCSGCPSSLMTLKQGVQNLLKHYVKEVNSVCLLYTSPSPRDLSTSRMPSSA